MLAFLALLGAPYIYEISSLRVNENIKMVLFTGLFHTTQQTQSTLIKKINLVWGNYRCLF